MDQNFKIGITHAGRFHADDVFATALLQILFPDIEIRRVKSVSKEDLENKEAIIYDIGADKYDHHQSSNKEYRQDGTQYATFGKLWRDFGYKLLPFKYDQTYVDNILVKPIDVCDNGGPANTLSSAISAFNGNWDDDITEQNERFDRAVSFAKDIINNYVRRKKSDRSADAELEKIRKVQRGGVLVLDRYIPINQRMTDNLYFIIYPNSTMREIEGVTTKSVKVDAIYDRSGSISRPKIPLLFSDDATGKRGCLGSMHNPPKGLIYAQNREGAFAIFDSMKNALNFINSVIYNEDEAKDSVFDFNDLMESTKWTVYDKKHRMSIPVYGIIKDTNTETYYPILSKTGMFSLSSLIIDGNNVYMKDDYFGMISMDGRTLKKYEIICMKPE